VLLALLGLYLGQAGTTVLPEGRGYGLGAGLAIGLALVVLIVRIARRR
jgi:pantoate kinase